MNSRLAVLLTAGALAVSASPASAATVLGQNVPTNAPTNGGCSNCSAFQVSPAPGAAPYVVPAGGGVITSWTFYAHSQPGTARLALYAEGPDAGKYTLVAETPARSFTLGETATTLTQIPVTAGVHLGVEVQGTDNVFNTPSLDDKYAGFASMKPIGYSGVPNFSAGRRINMSVILEPDADHDGYGDETQDGCPTDPAQQLKCAPGTPSSPQTPSTPATPATPATNVGSLVSLVTPSRESIRSGYVTLSATSVGKVTVSASGRIGSYRLRSASKTLQTGGRATLKLKLSKKTLRAIRKRLAHHRRVSAKVTVTAGGSSTPLVIQLVR